MAVTVADIAKLRKLTGAGMMDCKKALEESNGDYERACEIIREKGKLVAAKRADRDAHEGVVIAKTAADNRSGVLLTLNCETDFVAKNADFVALANSILEIALEKMPADLEALKALSMGKLTVGETVTDQSGITGEKMELSYYEHVEGGFAVAYNHPGNRLASMVAYDKELDAHVAREIAMQVAAMAPVAIDKDDVAPEIVEKELEIAREKARLEGKAEAMLDKIAQGRLAKFYQESTLLNQEFVKEGKIAVREYLKNNGGGANVTQIRRYSLND